MPPLLKFVAAFVVLIIGLILVWETWGWFINQHVNCGP